MALHIILGDAEGDRRWLEKAAGQTRLSFSWVVPRAAEIGDEVVLHIPGEGLYATAVVRSAPIPRTDRDRRWGSRLDTVRLIQPPISISAVLKHVPDLRWARYPRSITTPAQDVADQVRALIAERRRTGLPDLDDASIETASLAELRQVALAAAKKSLNPIERRTLQRIRSRVIRLYVLGRAGGVCEGCQQDAPFLAADGRLFLETHHITTVASGGADHPDKVMGLCPTCHSRVHHAKDKEAFNASLKKILMRLVAS